GYDRRNVRNLQRRQKSLPPLELGDDSCDFGVAHFARSAVMAIQRLAVFAKKVKPGVASQQNVERGRRAEAVDQRKVMRAQQRVARAKAIAECAFERLREFFI